jgi:signal transduction histidine kinase
MTPAFAIESSSAYSTEDVLRDLAHEIRQPLSTIESIAYYLSLVLPEDERHRGQLSRVQQLVEQSNWILANSLTLADSRRIAPGAVHLGELVEQIVAARPSSLGPRVNCDLAANLPPVRLDPGYARALIENILGLFRQLATAAHPIELRALAVSNGVELNVSTTAPGYRSIAMLPPGSSLSLDCARHIAMLHGGSATCSIDPASGIRVRVMLP